MMTAKKTHWLRTTIIVLVICGIAGLALTSVLFFKNPDPTYASATLQFTFDSAAQGIAPNNAAFDISGIASDEVLENALKEAALEGTYTVDQLRDNLVARGVYPEDMADKVTSYESLLNFTASRETTVGDFHATTYDIALFNNFDPSISRANLEGLMKGVTTAYKAWFKKVYSNGLATEDLLFTLDNYDYPQQLEILSGYYNTMALYANEMYEREPAFRVSGAGFNDISVRFNTLIKSDISRLNADITMNALTRDTARLLTQYQYEIRDLNIQLEKYNEQLAKLDALVDSYDKNEILYLSTTDSLTKIDGNSSATYDILIQTRKAAADNITVLNSQMTTYQLMLSDLLKEEAPMTSNASTSAKSASDAASADSSDGAEAAETSDSTDQAVKSADEVVGMTDEEIAAAAAEAQRLAKAQTTALEKNISALEKKGETIVDDFQAMLTAYNDQEINDLTVAVISTYYQAPKIVSGAFVKLAIKTAGPICAIGFMLCMVMIIVSRRKEERQK